MSQQPSTSPAAASPEMDRRTLGLGACVALVLGSIVGIGIFLNPPEVAKASPNLWIYAFFWVFGALVAIAGALVYAELGSMFPRAGGEYVFLDKAYGRPVAYAWGWMSALITFPGSIAALFVFATDTLASTTVGAWLTVPFISLTVGDLGQFCLTWGDVFAVSMIWFTTLINCHSVTLSGWVQLFFTWTPIAVFLVAGSWIVVEHGSHPIQEVLQQTQGSGTLSLSSMTFAFCTVFWAYSGWNVLVYIGGEVKKPGRNIPLGIVIALATAMLVYLLLNIAFLSVTPLPQLSAVRNVGIATTGHMFGDVGSDIFGVVITIAVLASMNVTAMAGSRISLAMARDGYLWKRMARTHPKRGTPGLALVIQATLTTVWVFTGSAAFLVALTSSVMLLLSCVTVSSLFIFRQRLGFRGPYRSFGYPIVPAFFILVGLAVVVAGALSNVVLMLGGIVIFETLVVLNVIFTHLGAQPRSSAKKNNSSSVNGEPNATAPNSQMSVEHEPL